MADNSTSYQKDLQTLALLLRSDSPAIETYIAQFATPQDIESMRFWVQQELVRIQRGFASTDEVVKLISGILRNILNSIGDFDDSTGTPGDFTADHNLLSNRDLDNQHPMSAITGLVSDQARQDNDLVVHTNDPDAHHNQSHALYGADHSDVDTVAALAIENLLAWDGTAFKPGFRTNALPYVGGNLYYPQQMVYQDGYLSVANKVTDDYPAPTPVGGPLTLYPPTPAWTINNHAGHVYSVLEVAAIFEEAYLLEDLQVWIEGITADDHYQVLGQDSNGVFTELLSFDGDIVGASGFYSIPVTPEFIGPGFTGRIWLHQWNSGSSTSQSFPWARVANTNGNGDPGSGNWSTRNNGNNVRINDLDDNGVDRSAVITDNSLIGTVLRMQQANDANKWMEFTINSITDEVGWVVYGTSEIGTGPTGEPDVGAVCDITFQVPVLSTTSYVTLANHLAPYDSFQAYYALDDPFLGVPSQDGPGVNLTFQEYQQSDDWDIFGLPGSGGGGGGGGLTPHVLNYHSDVDTVTTLPNVNDVLAWDGTNWVPQVGGGSLPIGTVLKTEIESITDPVSGEFDFTVPAGYDRLVIEGHLRSSEGANNDDVACYFNGDVTPANYRRQNAYGVNGSSSFTEGADANVASAPAGGSVANAGGQIKIEIEDPGGSLIKGAIGTMNVMRASGIQQTGMRGITHNSLTAAITQLTIRTDNHPTQTLTGKLTLYGEKTV